MLSPPDYPMAIRGLGRHEAKGRRARSRSSNFAPISSLSKPTGKVWLILLRKRNIVVLAPVLAVVMMASACVANPSDSPATTTVGETTTGTEATTTSTEPATTTSAGSTVQGALRGQIDELIEVTEDLRELDFLEAPTVTVVTDEELATRVREQIEEELDPDDLARDTALQVLLGLIGPDVDLLDLYTDLYSEQVAGYYDGEQEEMVVPADAELNALQKVTLVHELTHALTDQHYQFDERIEQLDDEDRFDELSAFQAVIEGDASFTELLYVSELPLEEQMEIVTQSLDQDTTVFDETPRFIQELLLFPYLEGSEFVQTLWSSNTGFDLVNEAYLDPPTTTEQVYHPEAYRDGEDGREVTLPDTPLTGYATEEEAIWGEVSFKVMFEQGLGSTTAGPAASGWGGDRYRVMWDGEQVAYLLVYVGDSEEDAVETYDALVAYAESSMNVGEPEATERDTIFVGEDYAHAALDGDRVLFIAASDPVAGSDLAAMLSDF